MTYKTTWANPDNLVVGFGTNSPERNVGGVTKEALDLKLAHFQIDYATATGSGNNGLTLPAGSAVRSVWLKVGTAWVGGTSLAIGDGGNTGGYITAAQAATANLTAGATINNGGAYLYTATEGQLPPKVLATATPTFVTIVGTFTAGTATVYIEYV